MELILVLLLLLIVFAVGPFVAMLHFVSREMAREEGPGIDLLRLVVGLVLLWIPFVWIIYFVLARRRPPLA